MRHGSHRARARQPAHQLLAVVVDAAGRVAGQLGGVGVELGAPVDLVQPDVRVPEEHRRPRPPESPRESPRRSRPAGRVAPARGRPKISPSRDLRVDRDVLLALVRAEGGDPAGRVRLRAHARVGDAGAPARPGRRDVGRVAEQLGRDPDGARVLARRSGPADLGGDRVRDQRRGVHARVAVVDADVAPPELLQAALRTSPRTPSTGRCRTAASRGSAAADPGRARRGRSRARPGARRARRGRRRSWRCRR